MSVAAEPYEASRIYRRRRATKVEMEARAEFLIDYARNHGPVTVRQLYYQAEVHGLPGIDKTDNSYNKVQRQVLQLRRDGLMEYGHIADATRWMRKPRSHNSIEDALSETARLYRRNLWRDADVYVEAWLEKDALAGVILPVTAKFDVPLMVTRGFSSETFCYEAVAAREDDDRPYIVYYLGDLDRAGLDARDSLQEKLERFGDEFCVEVEFHHLGITTEQVQHYSLPTRKPKRNSPADRKWAHDSACELDAMPPDVMRATVEVALEDHLPEDQMTVLKEAEASERQMLAAFAREAAA